MKKKLRRRFASFREDGGGGGERDKQRPQSLYHLGIVIGRSGLKADNDRASGLAVGSQVVSGS